MKNKYMKIARIEKDLSQKELADIVGVTRQTIGMIESGKFNPSLNLCTDICIALDRTLNDLFWDYNKNRAGDIEMVLLKTVNNQFELDVVKELLDDNEIPYLIKDYGSGGYMRIIGGTSLYRTDILVAEATYEKAKAIIDAFPWNEGIEDD